MDDHMLDRIESEIDLCFYLCKDAEEEGKDYKELREWKAASILISTYNKLVKIYYLPKYVHEFLKKNVALEYKNYKEWN